ncbi:MAG: hypothetical protein LBQ65_09485 [Tannerellaceae bacterium]|jgi:two-component SAPR family response regulator|nr:hypothetical protein [Tannerellaceae bacterium]
MIKHCLLTFLLCTPLYIWGVTTQYGLKFHSYEVEKEKRTGLNLTPNKPFSFPDGFVLSFDVNFNPDWVHPFGSIFRVVTEDRHHIDFILSEIGSTGETMVSFISSSDGILFEQPFDAGSGIDYGRFIPVEIGLDIRKGLVTASVGSRQFSQQTSSLKSFRHSSILFGKSHYPRFQTTDVPSFTMKNLRINNIDGRPLYEWPLAEHTDQGVYDKLKEHFARCENPEWLLDRHAFWQKQISLETRLHPQFCYNRDKNEVAVFDQDTFICFHLDSGTLVKNKLSKRPVYTYSNSNNLIYNPFTKTYHCYLFDLSTGLEVLVYDSLTGDWNQSREMKHPPEYWHHNRFFSPIDSNLYLMNGYGHHKYKNIVNRYDYHTLSWEPVLFKGDRIQPRYLSGLGAIDEQHLILFGGHGSESGNQEVLPQCFYDLYTLDLQTLEAKKRWEMESPALDFVVGNSLVPAADGQSFYALAFPHQQFYSSLVLLEISMNRPEYRVVADSIPFYFEDIKSNADLYLDPSGGSLIAVVVMPLSESSSQLTVYTLSNPPLASAELYQAERKGGFWLILLYALAGLLCVGALALALAASLFFRERKGRPVLTAAPPVKNIPSTEQAECRQAIYLFGDLQILDKDGLDLAKEFTPMQRQLFTLLLLYTEKNGKGVSSSKLKDTLWFDKSEKNAKNNRGVFVNKLRQIFEQIGMIYIKNQDLYWSLEIDDSLYCDYIEAMRQMKELSRNKKDASSEEVKSLLSIVGKGELLPNLQVEWIDGFKSDFSNKLIDLLLDIYKQSDIRKSCQVCINLADVIFIHDSLNEDALSIKCHHLVQMGKYGLAQKVYAIFVKEYKTLFNADFAYSFEQVIRKDSF